MIQSTEYLFLIQNNLYLGLASVSSAWLVQLRLSRQDSSSAVTSKFDFDFVRLVIIKAKTLKPKRQPKLKTLIFIAQMSSDENLSSLQPFQLVPRGGSNQKAMYVNTWLIVITCWSAQKLTKFLDIIFKCQDSILFRLIDYFQVSNSSLLFISRNSLQNCHQARCPMYCI